MFDLYKRVSLEVKSYNLWETGYYILFNCPTVLKEKTGHTSNDSNSDRDDEETSSIPNRGRSRAHLETSEPRNSARLFPGYETIQGSEPETPELAHHSGRERR